MSVVIPTSTRWCCPISCCDIGTLSRSSSYTIDDIDGNITSSSSSSSSSSPCIPCIPYNVIDTNSDINIDTRNCISCDDGCRWICQPNPNHKTQSSQASSSSSPVAAVTPSITTSTPSPASTTAAAAAAASTINTLISSSSALSTLAEHTLAYVNVHGMCMLTSALHTKQHQHDHVQERKEGQHDHQVAHLPVTLLPTKMSRSGFNLVNRVAPLINTLMDYIARDSEFLNTNLASCITVDPFQRKLLDIYNRVKDEGKGMDLTLSINRADYMLDGDDMTDAHPLQVEVNTISAGLITLAQRVQELHSFILERHVTSMVDDDDISDVEHPPNHSFDGLISAMKLTVDTFCSHHMSSSPKPRIAILFVVQPIEFNISDQRQIEYALWDKYKIPVYRRTLTQIYDMTLNDQRHLIIDGYTIALVYFRSGYAPTDFPTENEWNALYTLETAVAVKCPDVGHHLAGTKKIQQVLAQPGVVERFLPASDAALVRSTYTGLYALDNDNPATQAIIADAIANPDSYVLKPQRNGGGNNFFGTHVANILSTSTIQDRQQYILMKRIKPVVQLTATIRKGQVHVTPCSSELGIFAAHLGSTSIGVLLNTALGYLLRTKKAESDEGGVASGNAVVDSPMLV